MIGFPRLEDWIVKNGYDNLKFHDYGMHNVFDMDDPEVPDYAKQNVEYTVDISDPDNHVMKQELKPNKTRADARRKLREEIIEKEKKEGTYDSRIDLNVLIIYIDNFSRPHFYRQLPKTVEYLEKYYQSEEDIEVLQFMRFHSAYYNTLRTNNGLYYGQVDFLQDDSTNVFDSFSRNGYMTGFFKDACQTHANLFSPNKTFTLHRWDHRGGIISCDNNYSSKGRIPQLKYFSGKDSSLRRCLYGQEYHDVQFDYATQFWEAYPNNRKFFRTHFSDNHEFLGILVHYMDDSIVKFLENFRAKGYLNDTIVTFLSDHGVHPFSAHFTMIPDNSRAIEVYLPILFHIVPKTIQPAYLNSLRSNEQSFISSYDVYATLKTIAENKPGSASEAESYPYILQQVPKDHD